MKLEDYEVDTLTDTLRELRHTLDSNDLLDDDLALAVADCLAILGVDDVSAN